MHGEGWRGRESGRNDLPNSEGGEDAEITLEYPRLEVPKLKTVETSPPPCLTLGEGHQEQFALRDPLTTTKRGLGTS